MTETHRDRKVSDRRMAAAWYAWGRLDEARDWHQTLHSTGDKYPGVGELEFADEQAAAALMFGTTGHLPSIQDAWAEYVKRKANQ